MKLMYSALAAVLMSIGFNSVQAYTEGENFLLGIATGAAARGTSYALKEQGGCSTGQSIVGGAFVAGVCTLAAQTRQNNGGNGALVQLAAATLTYMISMYIIRTVDARETSASVSGK